MDQQKLKKELFAEIDRCVSVKLNGIMATQKQLQQKLNDIEQKLIDVKREVRSGGSTTNNGQLIKLDDESMRRMTVVVRADIFTEINKTVVPAIKKLKADVAKVQLVAEEAMFDADSALDVDRRRIHGERNNDLFVLNE